MNILGISAGFHDAAIALIDGQGHVRFAAHSERYSKIKNDPALCSDLLAEISGSQIDHIAFYERPAMHNLQQWLSRQRQYQAWTAKSRVRELMPPGADLDLQQTRYHSFAHHLSHAAAAFQTSPFESAAVVVIDAIGELDTISVYRAWYDDSGRAQYQRVWRQWYPHSLGLFYSAVTKHVGLRPMDEEYITMGMCAFSTDQGRSAEIAFTRALVDNIEQCRFTQNLHAGLDGDWSAHSHQDLAAGAQRVTERMIMAVMNRARELTGENKVCYGGGVALNCLANRRLGEVFDSIWIMPCPGDAGSSIGAAALVWQRRLDWRTVFLGHDISGTWPVNAVLDGLLRTGIVGVAAGRAEFGPRALGNRSLLADPRGADIKDRVNHIKHRQLFRPFAPAILAEFADQYFAMPRSWARSDYMQVVAPCRRPDLYPAVCHVDGTSRVQTVPCDGSGLRQLLEKWFVVTGCPMLLNTSLNVRGEPMVNDIADAQRFSRLYHTSVVTPDH